MDKPNIYKIGKYNNRFVVRKIDCDITDCKNLSENDITTWNGITYLFHKDGKKYSLRSLKSFLKGCHKNIDKIDFMSNVESHEKKEIEEYYKELKTKEK